MNKHTKEPWTVNGYAIEQDTNKKAWVIGWVEHQENADAEANADHIVSCVNACAGINPEAFPKLLTVLKKIVADGQFEIDHCGKVCFDIEDARVVIVKAEHK